MKRPENEQTSEPKIAPKKTVLEWLKPFWWARGIVAAIALVHLADSLHLVREDWLRIVHAVSARWDVWMTWVTKQVSTLLPWDWQITPMEGTYLTLWATLVLPAIIPQMWVTTPHIYARVIPAKPEHSTIIWRLRVIGEWSLRAMPIVLGIVLIFYFCYLVGPNPEPDHRVPTLATVGWFAASNASMVFALWDHNRGYLKALVATFGFLLTLELFYLAPVIQDLMRPLVDAVDPAKSSAAQHALL